MGHLRGGTVGGVWFRGPDHSDVIAEVVSSNICNASIIMVKLACAKEKCLVATELNTLED